MDSNRDADAEHNVYKTLQNLFDASVLSAGDTVILHNGDFMSISLAIPVNFRSSDPGGPYTVNLSNLGNAAFLYNLTKGSYTMNMDSIIWADATRGVIRAQGDDVSLEITGRVQFLNNAQDSPDFGGGAICMSGDSGTNIKNPALTFKDSVAFTGNHSNYHGGAIYMNAPKEGNTATLTFKDNVNFSGNYAAGGDNSHGYSYGGAIFMTGFSTTATMIFEKNATFLGNHASGTASYGSGAGSGYGGAICMSGNRSTLIFKDSVNFSGNYAENDITDTTVTGSVHGGAIDIGGGSKTVLSFEKDVTFSNNYVSSSFYGMGGAIDANGTDITMTFGDNTVFTNNHVYGGDSATGGAIEATGGNGTVMLSFGSNANFIGNHSDSISYSNGGAISMGGIYGKETSLVLSFGENAIFSKNYADSSRSGGTGVGGALYMVASDTSSLSFWDGVIFTENYAKGGGGAIFVTSGKGESLCRFLAFTHDVVFSGNMTGGDFNPDTGFPVKNGIANAIYAKGNHQFQLAAVKGREVRFDDPITGPANVTLSLNQYTDDEGGDPQITEGTVVFNGGRYNTEDDIYDNLAASRYNDIKAQTTLYGGTLVLENNVVFGNRALTDDTFMVLENGSLEITGGSTINASSFTVNRGDVILRPGSSAFINAKNVDLSHGFVFDMQKQIQGLNTLADTMTSLAISSSDSFILGEHIGVLDTGVSFNYYYADNAWAQERSFVVFTDVTRTHTGDLSGAYSIATGSDRVESPYTYTGTWRHQWEDMDGDGFAEQLQLVWTPDPITPPVDPDTPDNPDIPDFPETPDKPLPPVPGIRDILPELAGTLTMNSMWSSASNVLGMSGTALGSLDLNRFTMEPKNNYWVKGMGDFLYHASEGLRDGFDYNGGGYAVGADRKVMQQTILGLGVGDLYGKMYSRSFVGDIAQQTRIALLYGGWNKNIGKKNTLLITGSAGYGWTDNKMNSFHTGNWSHGKWTNRTLFGTLNGKWSCLIDTGLTWDLLFGAEYTDVTQETFTETGWDARRFDKGHLRNLSLPVGMGVTCRDTIKGMEWSTSVAVSYLPDVFRQNPSASATRLLNGYRWESKGTAPDRNAVRANFNSTLVINPQWAAYTGYEFEGRSKATVHRFNAGISYAY